MANSLLERWGHCILWRDWEQCIVLWRCLQTCLEGDGISCWFSCFFALGFVVGLPTRLSVRSEHRPKPNGSSHSFLYTSSKQYASEATKQNMPISLVLTKIEREAFVMKIRGTSPIQMQLHPIALGSCSYLALYLTVLYRFSKYNNQTGFDPESHFISPELAQMWYLSPRRIQRDGATVSLDTKKLQLPLFETFNSNLRI